MTSDCHNPRPAPSAAACDSVGAVLRALVTAEEGMDNRLNAGI
jgi:hypothetical protein